MARVRLQVLGVAWLALSACGGAYRRSPGDDEPSAGTGGVGGSDVFVPGGRGGVGPGGAGSGGLGAGGFGAVGADGGFAGFGGTVTVAGAAGQSACSPYVPTTGEPRLDGSQPLMGCANISDELLRQRFVDFDARVPQGLFFDREATQTVWTSTCARSVDEVIASRGPDRMGTLLGSVSSPWELSATFCSRGERVTQKSVRCDYFDGVKLTPAGPGGYEVFASLLWWRDNYNRSGAAILGYSVQIGSATDVVELCTLAGTQGDFGLCDQLELYSVKYRIMVGGEVTPEKPVLLRTVQGKCH